MHEGFSDAMTVWEDERHIKHMKIRANIVFLISHIDLVLMLTGLEHKNGREIGAIYGLFGTVI